MNQIERAAHHDAPQMKTNLLGMSFLDRLESWGVQADKVMLHGYPDVAGRHKRRAAAN